MVRGRMKRMKSCPKALKFTDPPVPTKYPAIYMKEINRIGTQVRKGPILSVLLPGELVILLSDVGLKYKS